MEVLFPSALDSIATEKSQGLPCGWKKSLSFPTLRLPDTSAVCRNVTGRALASSGVRA